MQKKEKKEEKKKKNCVRANTVVFWPNTFIFVENTLVIGANTVVFGTNTVISLVILSYFGTKKSYLLQIQFYLRLIHSYLEPIQ